MALRFSSRLIVVFVFFLSSSCGKPERQESLNDGRTTKYGESNLAALRTISENNQYKVKTDAVGTVSKATALNEQLFDLIHLDELSEALAIGRSNMDSEDPKVRKTVAEAFAWIGRRALPELAEMIEDSSPEVSDTATDGWLAALDDIHSERLKGYELEKTLPKLKSRDHIEQALMQFASFNEDFAKEALATTISKNEGTMLAECAREMYKYVANGAPFVVGQKAVTSQRKITQTIKQEKTR